MLGKKEIGTAVGALACAVGIGFVMQGTDTASERYGTQASAEPPVLQSATVANAMLDVQEITLTSGELDAVIDVPETMEKVETADAPATELPQPEAPQDMAEAPACEILAEARPVAAAMVDLTLSASCLPNERVTVHHNGMIFSDMTSADGTLDLRVPALAEQAVFILAFSNGEGAVAQTTVEELADYNRAVVQWKGDTGFQIHAREFGANYGDPGHLWVDAPGDIAGAVSGGSGVITRHGAGDTDEPLIAEVYSFPKAYTTREGAIQLSVETEVTDANCGIEIEAQSLEVQPGGAIKTSNLILPVPDCDAKGSFLVLNNLLQDLKVAGQQPSL